MRWLWREASLATALAAMVLTLQPTWSSATIRAWLVVVGILGSGAILSEALARFPVEAVRQGSAWPGSQERPATEVRHMRDIEQANDFLLGVDYQLFPFLRDRVREIAAHRLLTRHNVDLEHNPALARRLLGEELWELVRPATANDERWGTRSTTRLDSITRDLEKL